MTLFILSFIAGVLTVAAPCILPLLPVIVGGSIIDADNKKPSIYRPLIIAGSLAVSIVAFSLLLKATTSLLGVPVMVWQIISGIIVILLGAYFLVPQFWSQLPVSTSLNIASNKFLGRSFSSGSPLQPILIGLSLGPVFNSCSPTYALIIASILPASATLGIIYLLAYVVGLTGTLLIVAYFGQSVVEKMGWLKSPRGLFRRFVGVLFVTVGLTVLFGFDKDIQAFILDRGWYDPISDLERSLK